MKTKDNDKKSRNREVETNRQPHLSGRVAAVGGLLLDVSTPQLLAGVCGYSSAPCLLVFRNNHPLPPPYQAGE
jgi:hypothetical protein